MRRSFLLFFLLLSSCAARQSLPPLTLIETGRETALAECRAIFPTGNWQFVHTIDFRMANGHGSSLLGITSIKGEELSCLLLTAEGMTLFSARSNPATGITVKRAVPPFDSAAFAQGLMADVRTIFLAPNEKRGHYGRLTDGSKVCRFNRQPGTEDILLTPGAPTCWQIISYSPDLAMNRSVRARNCQRRHGSIIPLDMEVQRPGGRGYILRLHLLRAEKL